MNFISIDVETANENMESICQIGLAEVNNGEVTNSHSWLIDPEDDFSDININIHGIKPQDVKGAHTYPVYAKVINQIVQGKVVVCHTHFDRVAMQKACAKYNLNQLDCVWLDSARIARRAWPDKCGRSGYGLANICTMLGYEFKHHDAEEDAKAAAFIVIKASECCGYTSLEQWLKRVSAPVFTASSISELTANADGNLFGETIVFTGSLLLTRGEAAQLAASAGCNIGTGVTKKTTLLVVGDQDITRLAGKSKSSKHLKAEDLIAKGYKIKIITETDFKAIIK